MPRPTTEKRISCHPGKRIFRPAGIPVRKSETVQVSLEEFEAIRLADVEGLRHEEAAERMGTSRPTLTRILNSARNKVGTALTEGRALIIEGGNVTYDDLSEFTCRRCSGSFSEKPVSGDSWICPKCQAD